MFLTGASVILLAAAAATTLFASSAQAAACETPSIRREWRTFSTEEKTAWIAAVNCLSNLPHDDALTPSVDPSISNIVPVNTSGSYYDDFVYMHMDLNTRIHFTGLFYPFHRWYVAVYEQSLKSKCGYTGVSPYWNWSADSADVYDSSMFQDSDPVSGLGGWGDSSKDFEVQDGAFSSFKLSYPAYHTLRRNFTLQPLVGDVGSAFISDPYADANASFTPAEVSKMVNGFVGDYEGMQAYMEGFMGAHGMVHFILGGDLAGYCPADAVNCTDGSPTFSANEPMFWMHHAMVDKVWYDWQNANVSANFWQYFGGSVQAIDTIEDYTANPTGAAPYLSINSTIPADGLFDEVTIFDVMNTTGGYLCYVYE
ncbi:Di-copper centre-containing protein [Stereum hirsutum FP-91666 SS1]|uniref:Di-copper centre-containing protein n=1 Tax=Stereum hirsutum (strain FP-91666) TaxID=721885 RepID=UPI000444A867|nr:Di-copper centre-containing protein [Stereum hirsutum FP-91666 SS1]EIM81714.1 Di-copper centre-containing protein [Stereum hirsutum FP-91666 SS1]